MKRREFLQWAGRAGAALAGAGLMGCMEKGMQNGCSTLSRPNILFIMSDDHDRSAMSCYGSKINQTPNLDRIANEGARLEHCMCTNSICAPSRAVILTGKYSHLNGVRDNLSDFDGSQLTLAKVMQTMGYQTAMIGKWHLKSEPTGFDYWNVLPGQGLYYNPIMKEMGQKKRYEGYVTDIITDKALEFLKSRDRQRPFFMMYHHKAPHREWLPSLEHIRKYEDKDIPEPETFHDDYSTRSAAAYEQEMEIENHLNERDLKLNKPHNLTEQQLEAWNEVYGPRNEEFREASLTGQALKEWKYQRYIKDYLRCIASVDENVGRVLDYLDQSGLADNTIVIYTSDQGFYLGEHGWFDKRFMYEPSLHMPFVIRYPGTIPAGSVYDDLILNIDFAPTMIDFAGGKAPDEMQGESFRSIVCGRKAQNWRDTIYYHYYEYPGWHMVKRHYGIRTERYKLIHFYYDIDAWELYDLKEDPHELNNLYGKPDTAELTVKLKRKLYKLKLKYRDFEPLKQIKF